MDALQEIRITVGPAGDARLIEAIDEALPDGWTRAVERERKAAPLLQGRVFAYHRARRGDQPAAFVSLEARRRWKGFAFQAQVLADETCPTFGAWPDLWPALSVPQQNDVLASFADEVLAVLPADALLGFARRPQAEG